jgi:hypothetical protein
MSENSKKYTSQQQQQQQTSYSVIVKENMSVNKQWSFRNINVITKEGEKKAETKVYGMYNNFVH